MIKNFIEWCNTPVAGAVTDFMFMISVCLFSISFLIKIILKLFPKKAREIDPCLFEYEDKKRCINCTFNCSIAEKIKHTEIMADMEIDQLIEEDNVR
jgi:hypothetical protein